MTAARTPVARVDLRREDFPFVIAAYRVSTDDEVWRRKVTGPAELWIPPLARQFGEPVRIRIFWKDGRVEVKEP